MQKLNCQRNLPFVASLSFLLLALAGCGGESGSGASSLAGTPAAGVQDPDSGTPTSIPPAASTTATGSAVISWRAPSTNTDGTPLTNLAGFYIRYGWSHSHMDQLIKISSANVLNCEVAGLPVGVVYYFAVSSYTTSGVESEKSAIVGKKI